MAIAGKVAVTPKGEWNSTETYTVLDLVSYNGNSYIAKQTNTGQNPEAENSAYWQPSLVAQVSRADLAQKEDILTATASGALVTIENSHDGTAEVSGLAHNLLPYPYTDTTKTVNGITFTDNGDGTITLNGEATKSFDYIYTKNFILKENTYYTFSGGFNKNNSFTFFYINSKDGNLGIAASNENGVLTFNTATSFAKVCTDVSFSFRFAAGFVADNIIIKPMLTKGTTPKPYVPYRYEVKSCGKNLIDDSKCTFTNDPIYSWINCKNAISNIFPNTTYTVSTTDNATISRLICNDLDLYEIVDLINGYTFTSSESTGNEFHFQCTSQEISDAILAGNIHIQLEISPTKTEYEEFHGDTYTVTATTEKAYVRTYDGVTNIFTDYGVELTAKYGKTENGAKLYEGSEALAFIESEDFLAKTTPRRNHLRNPYYKVNQRGQSHYSVPYAYTNTIDGWKSFSTEISVLNDGINVQTNSTNSYSGYLQTIPEDNNGKVFTFSILFDGDVHSHTYKVSGTTDIYLSEILKFSQTTNAEGNTEIGYYITDTNVHHIGGVKLEEGSTQTLCYHDGSKWVLYDDYDYERDLLECMSYRTQSWDGATPGTENIIILEAVDTSTLTSIELPVKMKGIPTIIFCSNDNVNGVWRDRTNGSNINMTVANTGRNRFTPTSQGAFVTGRSYAGHYVASYEL